MVAARAVPAVLGVLLWATPLTAQHPGPRVGVVLSGGAAKGLAHIGVLQALERAGIPVDVITGTSMGALVGGLYATGYGADTLAAIARSISWDAILSDRIERRYMPPEQKLADGRHLVTLPLRGITPQLPARLVGGHNVRQLLAQLTWPVALVRDFRDLPIPFAAVAADLASGEPVVFTEGHLLDALTATMAIPGVFPPASVDGRVLVDGGVVRNLPAQDALALGAEVLVCSDVTDPLEDPAEIASVLEVVDQTIRFMTQESHREERARCDIVITPDIEGLNAFDFQKVDAWIVRGVDAAKSVQARLDTLAARTRTEAARRAAPASLPRRVDALAIPDLDSAHARLVRRRMGLDLPATLESADLAEALDRLYATRDFDHVGYVLEAGMDSGVRVVVRTGNEGPATLGIGLRYESTYRASLLFTGTFIDRLGVGSRAMLDLRLGEQLRLAGMYQRRFGTLTPWSAGFLAGYERVPVDLYTDGTRTAEGRFDIASATATAGVAAGTAALGGVLVTGTHARTAITTGAPGDSATEDTRTFYTVGAMIVVDTRDAPRLPHGGILVHGRTEWADQAIGSGGTFQQHILRASAAVPAGPRLSLLLRAEVGASAGADLPPHYLFYLGGAVPYATLPDRHLPFLGLRHQELSGRYVQVVGAGLQARLPWSLYAQALWNAGTVLDTWEVRPDDWLHGVGAALSVQTPFGTASSYIAGAAFGGPYRFEFDVGFGF